jgi:plasmid stabilization system protein ParE
MRRSGYAITETAEADLRDIVADYTPYSIRYVVKIKRLFRDCFRRVGAQPISGKSRNELSFGLRSVVVDRRFIVFFRREGKTTNIVRVMDGRRNITAKDFGNDPPDDE